MSNLLRTIQQVTRDYVDSISHRLPSIKNGSVTATSSDGTATVRVDGDTATTASVPSIATVKTGDRVKMVLFNRQLTILGAIQRTDKLVADTVEKSYLLNTLYPVGSIYTTTSTATTCPIQATLGGTWVNYGGGRVLAGLDTTQTEFNSIGKTGGEKTHTLTEWQMPTHQHFLLNYNPGGPLIDGHSYILSGTAITNELNARSTNVKTLPTGSGQAHNNLQPYIVVRHWRRTA